MAKRTSFGHFEMQRPMQPPQTAATASSPLPSAASEPKLPATTNPGPGQFATFLSSQYPGSRYETEPLSGGLVNITARARLCEPSSSSNNASLEDGEQQQPPASLVMKYAPPFIAAVGASAPFSQGRQASNYLIAYCLSI
ncbi:hypothetical protein B0T26DRAFT_37959 [Lasiosphaeria miniovina]|uniref:Uncharacterized protein n=1 Tax=Lasiosphaeria miniovina TaxID=1954250 RepID=A0AA40E9Y5_9PEZI|nr:uncharacterized protein B0T26DRAFT_37959 [Lasiosphaeria miniovina]KAK0733819.1 hypothetical protein B0T26DRAFT_37959 [Lasiosphaeria miniovina]